MSTRAVPGLHRALGGALLAAAVIGLCAACSGKSDDAAAAAATTPRLVTLTSAQLQRVRLYTVAPGSFHKSVQASGVVDFDNDQATSVLAPMSGPVSRLLVEAGQAVRAGQPLATVDSPDYATAVSTYRKALSAAQNARRIAETDKDLAQHNGVSAREAQQAQSDAAGAEADRDAARQTLVSLKLSAQAIRDIQQGRATSAIEGEIRAPIAGTVAEKLITPGQLLQAGTTPAFTIANLSRMWVMAQIPASDLASIHVGDTALVETGGAPAAVSGVVDNIGALVNPDTRAVLARVAVTNPGGVLKKQMYVRVTIQSRQATSGLLAPVSAILRDDENLPFVYVAQAGGGFARRHVTLGYRAGDQYEIAEGLQAGERVVVDGGLFVQFMQNQ
ncbi:efflux RND transporter periplasmic adaptor subunit [Phenylobacterium sp.]|uniref:efflux RND transporter periplasmic adaptor subunit n=1 Tax=Phenylobacterium sp. TaxID=1871053 RepID=UPI002DE49084|nr:efflux RND transporter periplasmic adaptor subunit [Phenylobacterium sp.]